MRFVLALCLCLLSRQAAAQLTDQFTDGDFTNNPIWIGQPAKFQVVNQQLQLNNQAITDDAYLAVLAATSDSARWSFYVNLDFAPSGNNRMRFYLSTDKANLSGSLQGYFVQIGETGSQDGVDLYRQDGNNVTKIIDGLPGTAANAPAMWLSVIRDNSGQWSLWIDSAASGITTQIQGQAIDTTYPSGRFAGVWCKHTSSNNQAFTFDDITIGPLFVDTFPPRLREVVVIDSQTIVARFNEPLAASALTTANYFVSNGIGVPDQASFLPADSAQVRLDFSTVFSSPSTYQLRVSQIADAGNNLLLLDSIRFSYYRPRAGDIRINELMPDPSPPVGWPEAEFIELYNTLPIPIDLTAWSIADGTGVTTLAGGIIAPGDYGILVDAASVGLFATGLPVVAVDPLPSLNNSSDVVTLLAPSGERIDAVAYTDNWYGDPAKSSGGWSLELIDPVSDCPPYINWRASLNNSGATPGAPNSWLGQLQDTLPPGLAKVEILDSQTLALTFTVPLDTASLQPSSVTLDPNLSSPTTITWVGTTRDQIHIPFAQPLDTGQLYQLQVTGIADCRGNTLSKPITRPVLIPLNLVKGDLVINEVLFNPRSGEVDYLELYNRSDKTVYVAGLELQELDDAGIVVDDANVADTSLLFPQAYVAFTADAAIVTRSYATPNPAGVITVSGMPNFPDEGCGVRIQTQSGITLDSVHVQADWHFPLLDDENGIALERIDPTSGGLAQQDWFSASSLVGYGTPAYRNSQFRQFQPFEGVISIDPEVVSPDGDGYQDQLVIAYQFTQPGYTGTVQVLDSRGRLVRMLEPHKLFAQSGQVFWDGLTNQGRVAAPGIYIIFMEVFNLAGAVKRYKKRCVVAVRP